MTIIRVRCGLSAESTKDKVILGSRFREFVGIWGLVGLRAGRQEVGSQRVPRLHTYINHERECAKMAGS